MILTNEIKELAFLTRGQHKPMYNGMGTVQFQIKTRAETGVHSLSQCAHAKKMLEESNTGFEWETVKHPEAI